MTAGKSQPVLFGVRVAFNVRRWELELATAAVLSSGVEPTKQAIVDKLRSHFAANGRGEWSTDEEEFDEFGEEAKTLVCAIWGPE